MGRIGLLFTAVLLLARVHELRWYLRSYKKIKVHDCQRFMLFIATYQALNHPV